MLSRALKGVQATLKSKRPAAAGHGGLALWAITVSCKVITVSQ